jgi:hypothetical protein
MFLRGQFHRSRSMIEGDRRNWLWQNGTAPRRDDRVRPSLHILHVLLYVRYGATKTQSHHGPVVVVDPHY